MKNILLSGIAILGLCLPTSAFAGDESGHLRYPVVLAHGFNSDADTFYALDIALKSVGVDDVTKTEVARFNSSAARGEELLEQILEYRALTGKSKVNIIAHSQGGLDARYVASVRPDTVASVTTLATPHFGVNSADLIAGATGTNSGIISVSQIIDFFSLLAGGDIQTTGALESLSSAGARRFNSSYPDGTRSGSCRNVPWRIKWWPFRAYKDYSVNDGPKTSRYGVQFMSLGGTATYANFNFTDGLDRILAFTSLTFGPFEKHDGLVGRCSTHFGDVVRDDYVLNHNDFVNATRGIRGRGTNDPVAVMKQQARIMKAKGL